ncbi:hypothetical protein RE428_16290 [Marinobacter nanhaiticus D15-8W]|uniref:Uncharacterized protein n=1 Tax=Marinobacter nanhaiticus D15-8W TaxID=626887 RepID=N6WWS3_9GAMM|nr:hypothetical protein [Marinobacter nanhaiticus]ENO13248.1 hypothetical protein J057_17670 [Marinobacter nanhaiticus D15-8W]BES70611.1 hypothetical protein RE428_16290 [Marinobacter nanhaiticus D15-8W]
MSGSVWFSAAFSAFMLAVSAQALAHGGHEHEEAREGMKEFSIRMGIDPGYTTEKCINLEEGARVNYRFDSQYPVDFNIHVHTATETLYPVKLESKANFSSTLDVEKSQEYCFTWKSGTRTEQEWFFEFAYTLD